MEASSSGKLMISMHIHEGLALNALLLECPLNAHAAQGQVKLNLCQELQGMVGGKRREEKAELHPTSSSRDLQRGFLDYSLKAGCWLGDLCSCASTCPLEPVRSHNRIRQQYCGGSPESRTVLGAGAPAANKVLPLGSLHSDW